MHRSQYKLVLSCGSSPQGAQMGRRNILSATPPASLKLHLTRLRWVDGDYDQFGAYWGRSPAAGDVYCAQSEVELPWVSNWDGSIVTEPRRVEIFVRATNRRAAKAGVREVFAVTKFRPAPVQKTQITFYR